MSEGGLGPLARLITDLLCLFLSFCEIVLRRQFKRREHSVLLIEVGAEEFDLAGAHNEKASVC